MKEVNKINEQKRINYSQALCEFLPLLNDLEFHGARNDYPRVLAILQSMDQHVRIARDYAEQMVAKEDRLVRFDNGTFVPAPTEAKHLESKNQVNSLRGQSQCMTPIDELGYCPEPDAGPDPSPVFKPVGFILSRLRWVRGVR